MGRRRRRWRPGAADRDARSLDWRLGDERRLCLVSNQATLVPRRREHLRADQPQRLDPYLQRGGRRRNAEAIDQRRPPGIGIFALVRRWPDRVCLRCSDEPGRSVCGRFGWQERAATHRSEQRLPRRRNSLDARRVLGQITGRRRYSRLDHEARGI